MTEYARDIERYYEDATEAELDAIKPPQDYDGDIGRYLDERIDANFARSAEARERAINPSEMSLRDELECFPDTGARTERVTAMYPVYAKEYGEEKARFYVVYATRGLLDESAVTRAIDKALLLKKFTGIDRHFQRVTDGEKRRMELPAFAQRRRNAVPLQLGIGALDAEIGNGAGIGTGEVLHLVGGEGGQKTSLALHAAEHYARNGGKVLFVSLDMHPREIELRLMMKLLNCSRDTVLWHAEAWDDRYRQACEARRELDANLSIIGGPLNLAKIKAAILASEAQAVIVDYVTIVNGFNGNELDAARGVTQFVREARDRWGITFVLLSQMSRESVKDVRQGGTGGHAKGGSSLEQLVDYEIELSTDEPLTEGGNRRLIAFLRKNRNGRKGLHFELFPSFPSMSFSERAEPVTRDPAKRKITFRSAW